MRGVTSLKISRIPGKIGTSQDILGSPTRHETQVQKYLEVLGQLGTSQNILGCHTIIDKNILAFFFTSILV